MVICWDVSQWTLKTTESLKTPNVVLCNLRQTSVVQHSSTFRLNLALVWGKERPCFCERRDTRRGWEWLVLACCLAFWPLCVASTCLPGVTSSVASSFFIVRTEAQVNRHLHSIVSLSLPRAGRSKGKCSTRLSSHSRAGWSACRGSFFTPHAHVQQTSCDHVHLVVLLWGRVSTALCRWCRLWPTRVAQKGSCRPT